MLAVAISMISCGGNEPAISSEQALQEVFAAFGNNPEFDETGFYFEVLNQGNGEPVSTDGFGLVSQISYNADGTVLGTTGSLPAAVTIGTQSGAIRESLIKLNIGGSIRVFVPATTGNSGQTAVFDLPAERVFEDVEDFNTTVIEGFADGEKLETQISDEGLYYTIDDAGEGDNPGPSSRVSVIYEGFHLNGDVFDSSNGSPITFGLNQVIRGWTLGIPLYKPGGNGMLIIPSSLAYGQNGNRGIPPNYPIAFTVELVEVVQ